MSKLDQSIVADVILVHVRALGLSAGLNWLNQAACDAARKEAEYFYDTAAPADRPAIESAWRDGWREGFGPVEPPAPRAPLPVSFLV